jgi:crotonobetainyl-CoA:carnitine CoA-transferase CaiB-like acyl-CoA transferase
VYRTADDKYLAIGALEPKFWLEFNRAIGRKQDLSELALGPDGQERLRAELQEILAGRPRSEWLAIFAAHDCCVEPVLEMDEVLDHPLHQERGLFTRAAGPDGQPVLQVRTPVAPARTDRPAPRLGQHSREVLSEYGFADDEIAALLATA